MKTRFVVLAGFGVLFGSVTAVRGQSNVEAPPRITPRIAMTLATPEIAAVHAEVRRSLRDPESARFGELSASRADRPQRALMSVCGTVNGKNSFGGYTGPRPFMGGLISRDGKVAFLLVGIGSTVAKAEAIMALCHRDKSPVVMR